MRESTSSSSWSTPLKTKDQALSTIDNLNSPSISAVESPARSTGFSPLKSNIDVSPSVSNSSSLFRSPNSPPASYSTVSGERSISSHDLAFNHRLSPLNPTLSAQKRAQTFSEQPNSPNSQWNSSPIKRESFNVKSDRRKSDIRRSLTPESHSVPMPTSFNLARNVVDKNRRVKSSIDHLSSLVFDGSPSKLGRGAMSGKFISVMNMLRFRGRDTQQLAILIALNISYSTTELLFGLFLGKIELVSDAFHLSFGCCILILCLFAMIWGRGQPDSYFTYGYGRLEVLAAFTNALFLMFLCFSLSVEALHAFMEDESEHKHYLIISAVANLLVNLVGVYFFRHHSKLRMQYNKPQDMNRHAIFLHLVSDSIRSGGVILASWLLSMGVQYAETLCMALVAVVVFSLTLPLVRSSGGLLLQMAPAGISENALHKLVREAGSLEGVNEFVDARFWAMVPGSIVGTLTATAKPGSDEQKLLGHIHSVFNDVGVTDLTVQIDKPQQQQRSVVCGVGMEGSAGKLHS